MNHIELLPINRLAGMKFFIPDYQRGYRWTEQQVNDLLNDIWHFRMPGKSDKDGIYCIQPLVVKKRYADSDADIREIRSLNSIEEIENKLQDIEYVWEVIDGQQRLTTILLILSYLEDEQTKFEISYQTRNKSSEFLKNINHKDEKSSVENIDFFFMYRTYQTIRQWFEGHKEDQKDFLETLRENVQFIWYETEESNPINIFTRLNIGKIPLTDSELIKAIFLNSSNFHTDNAGMIRLEQMEIAAEWDKIEYTLQKDEFWLFIKDELPATPTRIDLILDMMRKKQMFGDMGDTGNDNHQTFRYFYNYFNVNEGKINARWLRETWNKVKDFFMILEEWYSDFELYHYVGFLINDNNKDILSNLLDTYKECTDKDEFKSELKERIKDRIKDISCLTAPYEIEARPKTKVRPLLILYNIQTVLNQNKKLKEDATYGLPMTYKFPFHLFKKEARKGRRYGWEIEHIASNSGDMDDQKNNVIYLYSAKDSCSDKLKKRIDDFIKNLKKNENANGDANNKNENDYKELKEDIRKELKESDWTDEYKNMLWNFTLLDSTTNQQYHNCVFPFKRKCIISKERGFKTTMRIKDNKVILEEEDGIAFVPPCTKNVFAKQYTTLPDNLSSWTYKDARDYLMDINRVLCNAEFIDDQEDEIEKLYEKCNR